LLLPKFKVGTELRFWQPFLWKYRYFHGPHATQKKRSAGGKIP